ncbi:MAG TPA: pyruvate, water dikinase regulatory protein [Pseudomonadales bacterium]|nr:pyruvate, water dikinase regulatory protein [Pseudomonadales bacterium]
MKRTAFFISDGTGITAETLGHALLAQFDKINFDQITLPYVDSVERAHEAVARINRAAEEDGVRPIIFDTVIDQKVRQVIASCNGFMVDIFSTFLNPLEHELGTASSYSVGKSHSINDDESYKIRIEAVHYALENDDGAKTRYYDQADVILVGASRSGKTPTCIYLALQFGIKAANYPLTDEDLADLDHLQLPSALKQHRKKVFGLTIDPARLAMIREERRSGSKYSSLNQCEKEIRAIEALYKRENVPCLDSTHLSIEEISTKILAMTGLKRRLV